MRSKYRCEVCAASCILEIATGANKRRGDQTP